MCQDGPGWRPLFAKRRRFTEMRACGWGVRAVAREVGVSPAAGHNWARGYTLYGTAAIKTVAPLDCLASVRSVPAICLKTNRSRSPTSAETASALRRTPNS